MSDRSASRRLAVRAAAVMPGGVNSPVRSFAAVGGDPVFVAAARGPRLTTADGDELIDLCCSWGPLILGHAPEPVVAAVQRAAVAGTSYGLSTEREVAFAELLCAQVPGLEQVRLVNSGTEAVMTALRLARGATGRDLILKFAGGYHGHADQLLVAGGSGLLTHGTASSAGVPDASVAHTLIAPYNDLAAVETIVSECGDELAAVIVEPVAGNMGLVEPAPDFLPGLRAACDRCGALLIHDEVITGFRLGPTTRGAQVGVTPDLVCLGKIIGGGLPIGAVGGRREVTAHLAPEGGVYQAGTLSGNPLAVAGGLATLAALLADPPYARLETLAVRLAAGLTAAAEHHGVDLCCNRLGGMFTPFFCPGPVTDLAGAKAADTARHAAFFHAMLARGVYLPPSQFEVCFLSAAHGDAEVDAILAAADAALEVG